MVNEVGGDGLSLSLPLALSITIIIMLASKCVYNGRMQKKALDQ